MTKRLLFAPFLLIVLLSAPLSTPQSPRFHVLAFYSTTVEGDHVRFAQDALKFLSTIAAKDQFQLDTTTTWEDLTDARLAQYQLILWLNGSPTAPAPRAAFQRYIEHGGAWLGFHASGYNDKDTAWPWFVDFLGGAVFSINSWPPLPAKLIIDEDARTHPVTANLPSTYVAPQNEWYLWKPNPRLNPDVRVLLTLDPSNYPLGLKDVVLAGDCPVVWTNTKYKMVYMNMGHGGKILTSPTQNQLFENAVLWLGAGAPPAKGANAKQPPPKNTAATRGNADEPVGMRVSPQAVVANSQTNKVYAVNSDAGTVTVVSPTSHTAKKIKVGNYPSTIGINSVTNRIYVANAADGTVSVIDGSADQVLATVAVRALPYVVSVNSASNKIYVSKTFSNTTTLIDGATNQARILNTGVQATTIVSSAALNKSYMINLDDTVTVLDGATDATSKIHAGTRAWGLTLSPATNKLYVGDTDDSTLSVIDIKTGSVHVAQAGELPVAIAVDSVSNRAYIANYVGNSVTVLDGATDAALATIPVQQHPQAIAADSATHMIYVANTGSHSVTVISGATNSVLGTVNVTSGPYAVAVSNALAYVKCLADDGLLAIDPHTLTATLVPSK
jgi:uncharacterized protein